jgi:ATP synthase protein I
MSKKSQQPPYQPIMRAFALMTTISSYIIGAILLGVFGGRWLDQYFGTNGIFLLLVLLAGLGAAMYGIYSAVTKFTEGENDIDD